jgi:hypothetical protein
MVPCGDIEARMPISGPAFAFLTFTSAENELPSCLKGSLILLEPKLTGSGVSF